MEKALDMINSLWTEKAQLQIELASSQRMLEEITKQNKEMIKIEDLRGCFDIFSDGSVYLNDDGREKLKEILGVKDAK